MQQIYSHLTTVIYDAVGALLPIGKRLYVNGYWRMAVQIPVSTSTATGSFSSNVYCCASAVPLGSLHWPI
jgi:hypothetical protein